MGRHPAIVNAMIETAVKVSAGAGGTRNTSGNSHAVVALEAELADLHKNDAPLVFTSGYVSNEAALGEIGRLLPNCLILSDEKNHASMIAGIRASGAESGFSGTMISTILNNCERTPSSSGPRLLCSSRSIQ
jgi:5-aminolevulinate synthase